MYVFYSSRVGGWPASRRLDAIALIGVLLWLWPWVELRRVRVDVVLLVQFMLSLGMMHVAYLFLRDPSCLGHWRSHHLIGASGSIVSLMDPFCRRDDPHADHCPLPTLAFAG